MINERAKSGYDQPTWTPVVFLLALEVMVNGSISPCLDKHCPVAPFDLSAQQVFLTPAGLCKNLTKTSIKLIYELPIQ